MTASTYDNLQNAIGGGKTEIKPYNDNIPEENMAVLEAKKGLKPDDGKMYSFKCYLFCIF